MLKCVEAPSCTNTLGMMEHEYGLLCSTPFVVMCKGMYVEVGGSTKLFKFSLFQIFEI